MNSKHVSFGLRGCKVSATVTDGVVTQTRTEWVTARNFGNAWGAYPCLSDAELRATIAEKALRAVANESA